MPSYLITGASRGLGLAFATELLKNPSNHVIATARNTSTPGLTSLAASSPAGKLSLVQLDILDPSSIQAAVETVQKLLPGGLDVFLSNAGVDLQSLVPFEKLDLGLVDEEVHIMITSTILTLRSFLPLVRAGQEKKIVQISSELGSIEKAVHLPGLNDIYSVCRAAINMMIRKWAGALKGEGITAVVVHPGWVPSTEMGDGISAWMNKYSPDYPKISTEDSATGVVKVIEGLKVEITGSFFNYDGTNLPW